MERLLGLDIHVSPKLRRNKNTTLFALFLQSCMYILSELNQRLYWSTKT